MDALSVKQKLKISPLQLILAVVVFAISVAASSVFIEGNAAAATRPCQTQYDAVAKALNSTKERTAEKVLDKCIKEKEGKPWCQKNVLATLSASEKKASVERCANWYMGGFMNPPNTGTPGGAVDKKAKEQGAALRPKYRADSKPDAPAASSSTGSSEAKQWCQQYKKDHPGANNAKAVRGTLTWSEVTCARSYDVAKKNKKCTTGSDNPHVEASCEAGAKAGGSSGGGGGGGSGSGGSGGSGSGSGGSGGTSGGSGSSSGGDSPKQPQSDTTRTVEDPALDCASDSASEEDCDLVLKYLNPIIAFLSAFVGIAVVIGIISGGIRYASASDDPQKSAAGRQMVRNSLIALVAYIFLYAALQWLIPQ